MAEAADKIDAVSAPTSDGIRSQIEETRREMSRTIDAIQARLSPRRLVEDGQSAMRNLLDRARQHPLPVAVAGLGILTAVIVKRRRRARWQRWR